MSKSGLSKIDELIDKISSQFLEDENKKKAVILQFGKLEEALETKYNDKKEILEYVENALAHAAGGIYIPYILWKYILKFISVKDDEQIENARKKIQEYLDIFFGESFFEEEEQRLVRPLLALYLKYEKPFEIDKFLNPERMKGYHEEVVRYIGRTRKFIEDNMRTLAIYKKKLALIQRIGGDFSLFELSVAELEEKAKQK